MSPPLDWYDSRGQGYQEHDEFLEIIMTIVSYLGEELQLVAGSWTQNNGLFVLQC